MNTRTTLSAPLPAPLEVLANLRTAMAAIRQPAEAAARSMQGFAGAFQSPTNLLGYKVVPCVWLPTAPPLPDEDARRIVRHGLHEKLPWLRMGEVGPKPGERTHAALDRDGTLFVSRELFDELMVTTHPLFGPPKPVKEGIFHARNRLYSTGTRMQDAWVGFEG